MSGVWSKALMSFSYGIDSHPLGSFLVLCGILCFIAVPASGDARLQHMQVAVTVDDLPSHGDLLPGMTRMGITQGVLDALKANGVTQAYGFANGKDVVADPDLLEALKEWLRAGYPIGNHTFSHADLDEVSAESYLADIRQMQKLLAELAPVSTFTESSHVFRYPYLHEGLTGEQRNTVRNFLFENGYRIAEVTIDWDDWAWNDAYTRCVRKHDNRSITWLKRQVAIVAEQHLRNSRSTAERLFKRDIAHILVLHDSMFNAAVLESVLRDFRQQGVELITLDRALEDPIYKLNPGAMPKDRGTFLERVAVSRDINIDNFQDTIYTPDSLSNICKQ